MKKILTILSICTLTFSAAYSQDDTYYTGDQATVEAQAAEAPPAMPQYVQPPCPEDGYLWNPGYWAWGTGGYYWVPGVWVLPPSPGLLWTPGYWGFYGSYYGWHHGYWGSTIGFYGGVNYGFGYYGSGFYGGRWEGGHFRYNTAVWHVNGSIHNVYSDRSVVHQNGNRSSFNGPHGNNARPASGEVGMMSHANHTEKTPVQAAHQQSMGTEKGQFAHTNNGRPAVHSMSQPGGQRFNQGGHAIRSGGGGGGGHAGGGGGGGRR